MSRKRLIAFVEGPSDKIFFDKLISKIFENSKKRRWQKDQILIITLDGIGNTSTIIKDAVDEVKVHDKFETTFCLIHDTDAFEFQKKPPINIKKVKEYVENKGFNFFEIAIKHNVEDMIIVSSKEIIDYLKLDPEYKIDKRLTGLENIKKMYKEAGEVYIKGTKSSELYNQLDYSKIAYRYCVCLKPLCEYFGLDCAGNNCLKKKYSLPRKQH